MKSNHPSRQSTPGILLVLIARSLASEDLDRAQEAAKALGHAVHTYDGLCRRYGLHGADFDDARQQIWERLYSWAASGREEPSNPDAYAYCVAKSTVVDLVRRRRRYSLAKQADELNASLDPIANPEPAPEKTHLARLRAELEHHVGAYKYRAELERRKGHGVKVQAWYLLRVELLPADDVARELEVANLARDGRQIVWKWAQRGAQLVRELALTDPDSERGNLMLRAAAA
jgi:DNA-directed RNA polymerase specialized sigma24 family protein